MFDNGILDDIIYGNLPDKSCFWTLLQHDYMNARKEKFAFRRLDMDYHFCMCRHTDGFQHRYHMSENAYNNLVNILHPDIAPNEKQSKCSTGNNGPVSAKMVTCMGLRFMGGEKIKSLADTYGVSKRHADTSVQKFLDAVDYCAHQSLSTNLLPQSNDNKIKLANDWNKCSSAFGIFYAPHKSLTMSQTLVNTGAGIIKGLD